MLLIICDDRGAFRIGDGCYRWPVVEELGMDQTSLRRAGSALVCTGSLLAVSAMLSGHSRADPGQPPPPLPVFTPAPSDWSPNSEICCTTRSPTGSHPTWCRWHVRFMSVVSRAVRLLRWVRSADSTATSEINMMTIPAAAAARCQRCGGQHRSVDGLLDATSEAVDH